MDKCLPNRDFLQLVEVPRPQHEQGKPVRLEHDVEWLAIVKATHGLLSRSERQAPLPTQVSLVTEEDKAWCVRWQQACMPGSLCLAWLYQPTPPTPPTNPRVRARLEAACQARGQDPATHALEIPAEAFVRTAPVYDGGAPRPPVGGSLSLQGSPQTDALLALLELGHRVTMPYQAPVEELGAAAAMPVVEEGAFFLDHGNGSAAGGGGGGDPNAIDIDLDDDEEEEGGDTIVFAGESAAAAAAAAASAPPRARARLVLPPPTASSLDVEGGGGQKGWRE